MDHQNYNIIHDIKWLEETGMLTKKISLYLLTAENGKHNSQRSK